MKPDWIIDQLPKGSSLKVRRDHKENVILGATEGTPQERFLHAAFSPVGPVGRAKAVRDNPRIKNHPYFLELADFNGASLFGGAIFFFGLHYYESGVIDFFPMPDNLILVNVERGSLLEKLSNGMVIGGRHKGRENVYFIQDDEGRIQEVTKSNDRLETCSEGLGSFMKRKILDFEVG